MPNIKVLVFLRIWEHYPLLFLNPPIESIREGAGVSKKESQAPPEVTDVGAALAAEEAKVVDAIYAKFKPTLTMAHSVIAEYYMPEQRLVITIDGWSQEADVQLSPGGLNQLVKMFQDSGFTIISSSFTVKRTKEENEKKNMGFKWKQVTRIIMIGKPIKELLDASPDGERVYINL